MRLFHVRAAIALSILALSFSTASAAARPVESSPGIRYSAEIVRDDWGIPHIHGKSDADAVFGMTYAQAEDDFHRVEINYLTSLGRLAEANGKAALWQDLRQRLFVDPARLKAEYRCAPTWLRRLMNAWAAGLNYYLATHPRTHPQVLTRFEPWMALSFTEGSIGGDIERASLPQLQSFYEDRPDRLTAIAPRVAYREPSGSNGFAIGPSHSASGNALLYINPHTSFYFRAELQMTSDEGLDTYGAVTWGQFFVYQGFNRYAGWMHTSSGVDSVDEFLETVKRGPRGLRYRYGTHSRPMQTRSVTLRFRRAGGSLGTRTFTTYATHHGPIVRRQGDKWVALALMNRPLAALEQSFLRTKTKDLAGFLRVAGLRANSSNNTIFADSKGEIAYLHPQFVPIRSPRFDYTKPVDGSDPATDWRGLHRLDTLPQVIDPANGWVMNTNDAPWTAAGPDSPRKDRFPAYMDTEGENARGPHAIRVLNARPRFDLDSLIEAGYDSYLTAFAALVPRLLAAYDREPQAELRPAIDLMRGWDYRAGTNSVSTTLAVFWGERLWDVVAKMDVPPGASRYDAMIGRMSNAQLLATFGEGVARLQHDFGRIDVPWGEVNRLQRLDDSIVPRFDDAKPSLPVPFASSRWGALASYGAQRPSDGRRLYGISGNSFVAAVEFGPRIRAKAILVGGQSGDSASPHFSDQMDRYVTGQLRDVYFYPDELKGHIERAYRIEAHVGGSLLKPRGR